MNNLQKMLFLGSTATRFVENFTTNVNLSAVSWQTNIYNDWTSYYAGANGFGATLGNGYLTTSANAGAYSWSSVVIYRTKEGYNINRSFDLSYSFYLGFGSVAYDKACVSIGGNVNLTGHNLTPTGLTFQATNGGAFQVLNNGNVISSNYGIGLNVRYYVFVKKRGNTIYYTVNTSGVAPITYDYIASMTDTTSESNALILYGYGNTAGDGNNSPGFRIYAPSILLY